MDDEIYRITRINPSDDHLRINEENLLNRRRKKQNQSKEHFKDVLEKKEHERAEGQKSKEQK